MINVSYLWRIVMNTPNVKTRSTITAFDQGLSDHFRGVYNVMSLGLLFTGLVAFGVANSPLAAVLFGNPILAIIVAFLPLAFIFFGFTHRAVMTKTAGQLKTLFFMFSAVFGLSLSSVFLVYAGADIARAFFIAAATFAATSVYGYVTKRDLSGLQGLLIMGVIGLLIAMVVNIFLQSSALDFAISVIGVLVYVGLVAFDTQQIKETYNATNGADANNKMAVMGALSLYINFIMLFQFILNLIGNRE